MSKKQLPRKPPNTFFRFSNLAIQMGVIIGLFAWGGTKLDTYFKTTEAYFTIVLSLLGIGASLYLVIRDVMSNSNNNNES